MNVERWQGQKNCHQSRNNKKLSAAEYNITAVFQSVLQVGVLSLKSKTCGTTCVLLNYLYKRRVCFMISVISELGILLEKM